MSDESTQKNWNFILISDGENRVSQKPEGQTLKHTYRQTYIHTYIQTDGHK